MWYHVLTRNWHERNWYLLTLSELKPFELFAVNLNFDTFNNGSTEALFFVKDQDFLHTIYDSVDFLTA